MRPRWRRACSLVKIPPMIPCVIGQQGEGEACPLVARMQHELRQAAFRSEYAIAGHYAVANQKAVEVLAHRRGEGVELLRPFRAGARRAEGSRRIGAAAGRASATVQLLAIQSLIVGSTGWRESFQSPCP